MMELDTSILLMTPYFGIKFNVTSTHHEKIHCISFLYPIIMIPCREAYASMVTSTKAQLNGKKPSAFVVSVGGGGMLSGILRGLDIAGDFFHIRLAIGGLECRI